MLIFIRLPYFCIQELIIWLILSQNMPSESIGQRVLGIFIIILIGGLTFASILAGLDSTFVPIEGKAITLISPFSDNINNKGHTPKDRVDEKDIQLRHDKVIIKLSEASLSTLEDANSDSSLFSPGTQGLVMNISSASELKEGDIVSYYSSSKGRMVFGRISKIGTDKQGWYAQLYSEGRLKIRFNQLNKVVVAVLY